MLAQPSENRISKCTRTIRNPITPYEAKLAGTLTEIFSGGATTLAEVVEGLNNLGLHAPDGGSWTDENFRAEMRRLGK